MLPPFPLTLRQYKWVQNSTRDEATYFKWHCWSQKVKWNTECCRVRYIGCVFAHNSILSHTMFCHSNMSAVCMYYVVQTPVVTCFLKQRYWDWSRCNKKTLGLSWGHGFSTNCPIHTKHSQKAGHNFLWDLKEEQHSGTFFMTGTDCKSHKGSWYFIFCWTFLRSSTAGKSSL